ncbi:MAG: carboxypeptidase Taq [Mariniblastus sp.]|jgi:carboxypeptidase Taq
MSNVDALYRELCQQAKETAYLESTLALLEWDQQTMLPAGADEYRSQQITFLAGQIHQRRTDKRRGELIGELAESELAAEPTSDLGATIRELKRDFEKRIKLPATLVESLAQAASIGQSLWVTARKNNDFRAFAPQLKKLFELKKAEAEAIGYDECPYDALLDEYEPGAKTSEVADVLDALRKDLVSLIAEIADRGITPRTDVLRRRFPIEAQKVFAQEASAKIGFDYDRGRLDITHHPFCTETGPHDCRLTTRYDENFFSSAFFGTLHESGHGIYEQGLRGEFYGLAPGKFCSLGIHESQSRMWENLVGRSHSFWEHFYPRAQTLFPEALGDVSLDEFVAAINHVSPSLIRVEADEATYNLHIIIRFQLEQAVINGDLDTDDLPAAWNEKYEQYLGIQPPTDADGVLQDVHWSAGLVGYFSTYSLGNLYASQFFDQAETDLGAFAPQFRNGEFQPLKTWLNQNIHSVGKCLSGPELGQRVTGQSLSHQLLIRQLREKLSPIYGL